jgi:hypothetical protein
MFSVLVKHLLHKVVPEAYVKQEWETSTLSLLVGLCLQGNASPKTRLSELRSCVP